MKIKRIKNALSPVSLFRKSKLSRSLKALALLLPTLLLVASCGETASERVEKVGGVTARQIIENPGAYVGKTVTVSGDVEEIWNPRAFNMDSGLSVGELLVVGREPFPKLSEAGDRAYVVSDIATVTGVVRMLVTADVEREIGWSLDPKIVAEFNAKPVLIAQSVSFKAGANSAATNSNANANQASNNDEITDYLIIVTPTDRAPLIGRRVRLTDVKVQSVVGDRTFYIGPSEQQRVLVALDEKTPTGSSDAKVNVNPGQTVSFTGVIERMPSVEQARERFGRMMNDAELNKLKDQQVFIRTDAVNVQGK